MAGIVDVMAGVAEILALIGEMDEANQIVNAFNLLSLDARISRFRQALLALALGNKRDSLSLLTQAVNDREAELLWLRVEPRFDPIRGEPAFADLLHTVFPHGYI